MFKISVGYCGSIDCCLKLTSPDGESREYLIESIAWQILDAIDSTHIGAELGQWIFDTRQEDERK